MRWADVAVPAIAGLGSPAHRSAPSAADQVGRRGGAGHCRATSSAHRRAQSATGEEVADVVATAIAAATSSAHRRAPTRRNVARASP